MNAESDIPPRKLLVENRFAGRSGCPAKNCSICVLCCYTELPLEMAARFRHAGASFLCRSERWTPMGRRVTPSDVANVCPLLCTDEAPFLTGQTIVVDGGSSLMDPDFPLARKSPNRGGAVVNDNVRKQIVEGELRWPRGERHGASSADQGSDAAHSTQSRGRRKRADPRTQSYPGLFRPHAARNPQR